MIIVHRFKVQETLLKRELFWKSESIPPQSSRNSLKSRVKSKKREYFASELEKLS